MYVPHQRSGERRWSSIPPLPVYPACLETMAAVSLSAAAVTMPTAVADFCWDQTRWVTPDECAHTSSAVGGSGVGGG